MKASRFLKTLTVTALLLAVVFLNSACGGGKTELRYTYPTEAVPAHAYPEASFAVISDVHIYDHSLGTSGVAFTKIMNSDRKLLLDGVDLLDYAVRSIIASGVRFVLVSGDLTKDGELINHQLMAGRLKEFTDAGIQVYVIPGNHDINNPGAESYSGDHASPVPTINAGDFSRIYGDFGFNAALMRDDDSLSYVAEPVEGLWLLALDSCRYRENVPGKEEIVSGRVSQKTADWIAGVLKAAGERKKAVIVMVHHGVVEHWKGQSKLHPDYLINDYTGFGKFLASWNVRLAFTGHYHAQDITLGSFGDRFLYDVETGSLVTAPCPIRYVQIKNNTLQISSDTIVDKIHPGSDFAADGRDFVKRTVKLEALGVLKNYFVSGSDADYIAEAVGSAFYAHYSGDEDPALRPPFDQGRLGFWGRFIYSQEKYAVDGLWTDLWPADNNVTLGLETANK